MTRVKRGFTARRRRNKILTFASGFQGSHSKQFRVAKQQKKRALISAERDRMKRKRDFRRLWIARINAAVRFSGLSYNQFVYCMYKNRLSQNRKNLAQIATLCTPFFSTFSQKIMT
uniref:50S ribosomal protein L20 n=1 Tax=Gnetum gnemon TaxID=3382 RepID=A0A1B2IJT0_GNEGN|nr:ribosomal protein L20 [Gnetum gnemon]